MSAPVAYRKLRSGDGTGGPASGPLYDGAVIDIRAARNDPERYRAALARRGAGEDFDRLLEADARWRAPQGQIDELRGAAKLKGKPTPEQQEELKARKTELTRLEAEQAAGGRGARAAARRHPEPGRSRCARRPDRRGRRRAAQSRHPARGSTSRRATTSSSARPTTGSTWSAARGSRAPVSPTAAATRSPRAGAVPLRDRPADARGFELVLPPVLVREQAMYGTGFLPTEETNLYRSTSGTAST